MIKPAIPEDEDRRLAALRSLNVLDTPNEERYDRVVRKLAELLDVPIAYLALIDANRQWLKSEVGGMQCEVDRGVSFCGHTILGTEPLVIPDATQDPRFADNPMVTGEPYIRFYAGFPLDGGEGHHVGTLCVADHQPRRLDTDDFELLSAFATRIAGKLTARPNVFISYSHRDEEWKDRLLCHLSVLREQQLLHLWDDRRIGAGDAWEMEIQEAMESSNVAILLISANYLTSEFILSVEVPRLLSRRDGEGLQIVPVVIKPCLWKQVEWLQRMNLYPKDGNPLSAGSDHEVDHLLAEFASVVLDKSRQAPKAPPPDQRMQLAEPAADPRPRPPDPAEEETVQQERPPALVRLAVTREGEADAQPEWFAFRRRRVVIGRHPSCDLPLTDRQKVVSSRHAEIVAGDDGHYLTDLGSKNFTYLNGERLEPQRPYLLGSGNVIGISEFEIRFEVHDLPASLDETGTVFTHSYLNPFVGDAVQLAQLLRAVAERYQGEAPSRRDDALKEALAAALEGTPGHKAHRVVGRLLSRRRGSR